MLKYMIVRFLEKRLADRDRRYWTKRQSESSVQNGQKVMKINGVRDNEN